MKTLSILAISILLCGCNNSTMPDFPDIKNHYLMQVLDGGDAHCVRCDIVNKIPYKVGNCVEVELSSCDMVGGYKPEDTVKLNNWLVDVKKWADGKAQCFKK